MWKIHYILIMWILSWTKQLKGKVIKKHNDNKHMFISAPHIHQVEAWRRHNVARRRHLPCFIFMHQKRVIQMLSSEINRRNWLLFLLFHSWSKGMIQAASFSFKNTFYRTDKIQTLSLFWFPSTGVPTPLPCYHTKKIAIMSV